MDGLPEEKPSQQGALSDCRDQCAPSLKKKDHRRRGGCVPMSKGGSILASVKVIVCRTTRGAMSDANDCGSCIKTENCDHDVSSVGFVSARVDRAVRCGRVRRRHLCIGDEVQEWSQNRASIQHRFLYLRIRASVRNEPSCFDCR